MKKCKLISEKIGDSNGRVTLGRAIDAVNAAVSNHKRRQSYSTVRGSVINMSFQVWSDSENRNAIVSAYAAGMTLVGSAWNSNCNIISANRAPSRYENLITLAASNNNYNKHPCSSYGSAVNRFSDSGYQKALPYAI